MLSETVSGLRKTEVLDAEYGPHRFHSVPGKPDSSC